MIPHRTNTLDVRVKTITPRQPKSFRNIIEEARERIAAEMNAKPEDDEPDLDEIAREAVEGNHQRTAYNRFLGHWGE